MTKQRMMKAVSVTVLWAISLLIIIPLYLVVINSFKDPAEAAEMGFSLPSKWLVISNYKEMIVSGGVLTVFINSVIVTFSSVILIILFSSTTAFILQRRKTSFSKALQTIIIMGLVLPVQIIPTFFICKVMHLTSFISAILVLTVANFSFSTFLYIGFIKSIPVQLDESAFLDGAGILRIFFEIIFPLLKPVTVTAIIIAFMAVWNDFGNVIYFLNSSKNYTLTLTIFNFMGTHSSQWNLLFANVVIVSLPVLILYFALQKYIIAGMTAGSVKG